MLGFWDVKLRTAQADDGMVDETAAPVVNTSDTAVVTFPPVAVMPSQLVLF